jgi:hypothetical protein
MKRILAIILPILAAFTFLTGTAGPALASRAPLFQIITDQGNASLCLNRAGGGTKAGTVIEGYICGNQNNNFMVAQTNLCNKGRVEYSEFQKGDPKPAPTGCPFDNIDFDSEFKGAPIVQIKTYYGSGPNLCAGIATLGSVILRLTSCSAGLSTVFVAPGAGSDTPGPFISVDATDVGAPGHLYTPCATGVEKPIEIETGDARVPGSPCRLKEIHN